MFYVVIYLLFKSKLLLPVQKRFWQSLLKQLLVSIYIVIGGWYSHLPSVPMLYVNVLVSSYAVLFSVLWFNSFIVQNICIDVFVTCFIAVDVDQDFSHLFLFFDISRCYAWICELAEMFAVLHVGFSLMPQFGLSF